MNHDMIHSFQSTPVRKNGERLEKNPHKALAKQICSWPSSHCYPSLDTHGTDWFCLFRPGNSRSVCRPLDLSMYETQIEFSWIWIDYSLVVLVVQHFAGLAASFSGALELGSCVIRCWQRWHCEPVHDDAIVLCGFIIFQSAEIVHGGKGILQQ